MQEQQTHLDLDLEFSEAPPCLPDLRDEIGRTWGLPIGLRVEVGFRGGDRSAITGVLELRQTPDFPWDPRQALRLSVAGFVFSSREIDRWTLL